MLKIVIVYVLVFCIFSCTKQDVIDTGISSPYYEGTIMQFLQSDEYNFKLTVDMIERGGLTDLFEGEVDSCSQITFLAFKTHTIYLFLLQNGLDSVMQLSPDLCRDIVLRHVIAGKHLKEEIGYRNLNYDFTAGEEITEEKAGGSVFNTLDGAEVFLYREKSDYEGVPDMGPEYLYSYSITEKTYLPMATPDIQPNNGVIHALTPYYRWTYELKDRPKN
ncbi:MAG: hypothetical protein ACLTSL_00175 [Odoribacter splanchnicus]